MTNWMKTTPSEGETKFASSNPVTPVCGLRLSGFHEIFEEKFYLKMILIIARILWIIIQKVSILNLFLFCKD